MEQARLFIAVALSMAVFLLWSYFTADKETLRESAQKTDRKAIEEQTFVQKEAPMLPKQQETDTLLPAVTTETKPKVKTYKTITVDTPLYTMQVSERGGVVKSFVLKKYRESVEDDSPFLDLISKDSPFGMGHLSFSRRSTPDLRHAHFQTQLDEERIIDVDDHTETLSFSWASPEGIVVEKIFSISPKTYVIGLTVNIKNGSEFAIQDSLSVSLTRLFKDSGNRYGFEGPTALVDNELKKIKLKKIEDKNIYKGKLEWIAIQDRYFLSSIIPETKDDTYMRLSLFDKTLLESQLVEPIALINPGMEVAYKYQLYFGPKSMSVLKDVGYRLGKVVNFGMFDIIAKPCVWFMNFLYGLIPNYGIAIIILTLFTKIILWPLGTKSYKSMAEMKKIQPLMTEIREKYKDDKKKMNEEIMGLYKTYKVNPLGGCLPMLVQLPIFFALYRMLYEAIELRHAPFFGWINDLSAPDRLFNFSFSIPFMQEPYGIPVLTLIMGGTMFLSQKMQPPMGDPMQARMMMLMPVIFTVIFINFSSGLVLYWLVNNVISVAQQYYTTKKNA